MSCIIIIFSLFCCISLCFSKCGDGFLSPTEMCDDGNKIDCDGCSSSCIAEPGGIFSFNFTQEKTVKIDSIQCTFGFANNDHDSVILWSDLSTKLAIKDIDHTNSQHWRVMKRDGQKVWNVDFLTERRTSLDSQGLWHLARPLIFPAFNKVVWFDPRNQKLMWDSENIVVSFETANISNWVDRHSSWTDGKLMRRYYFISDGINRVHIGHERYSWAFVLTFNWTSNSVFARNAQKFHPIGGWWYTSNDAFGHFLWTVNGQVFYRSNRCNFTFGGDLFNPNSNSASFFLPVYTGCGVAQTGLDFFGRVDPDERLWLADWGHDNGGFFGCRTNSQLGIGRTNIFHINDSKYYCNGNLGIPSSPVDDISLTQTQTKTSTLVPVEEISQNPSSSAPFFIPALPPDPQNADFL